MSAGFVHSSFTFGYESNVRNSDIDREFAASSSNVFNLPPAAEVAPGSLISFLQKGLQYLQIETEIRAVSHSQALVHKWNGFILV